MLFVQTFSAIIFLQRCVVKVCFNLIFADFSTIKCCNVNFVTHSYSVIFAHFFCTNFGAKYCCNVIFASFRGNCFGAKCCCNISLQNFVANLIEN